MEALLRKLDSFSRQLELEDNLPYWEGQKAELQARISELKENKRKKERELGLLKEPNLFQKLLGKSEEKRGRFRKQIEEITAAQTAACWELESIIEKIESGEQELANLAGSRAAYEEAKTNVVLTPAQESRIMMAEITAFAPAALRTAERLLDNLENARFWIRKEKDNRDAACLQDVESAANRLGDILSVLPEGVATIGSYLQSPVEYISGDDSWNRLHQAQEQIRNVSNQLRLLLGE